jgi:CIC family chloride channel protein
LSFKQSLHTLLSRDQAKLPLALLGIVVGIVAGLFVNLFRFILEGTFPFFNNGLHHDDFEALSSFWHFFLPVAGCLIIGQLLHKLTPELRRMGVSYVIDKVQRFRTRMPIRNSVMQFVTASIALLSGGSCGREGPAIHLGATSGCAIGYSLSLPNNSIRTLIAAGSAAAISAAFNTPIAGVIFAIEVILMEYALSGIIPVIVAAVSGAVVTQILFGGEQVFIIDAVAMSSLWQLPWVIVMGLVIGILASLFVKLHKFAVGFGHIDLRIRLLATGLLTGFVGLFMPEILGTGYDSLNDALQGNLALTFLLALLSLKLIVTAVGLGLGLPGGLIGPSLVLGGLAGATLGLIGEYFMPGSQSSAAFYGLIGMCAMMGATLHAPLAALMALLELSNNPNIILPAMLIIVVANMTSSEIFKTRSVFMNNLESKVSDFSPELSRFLNRFGISALANHDFQRVKSDSEETVLRELLEKDSKWIVIDHAGDTKSLLSKSDLEAALATPGYSLDNLDSATAIMPVSQHATLLEAMEILVEHQVHHGYIHLKGDNGEEITGVFSQDDIMAFYRGSID